MVLLLTLATITCYAALLALLLWWRDHRYAALKRAVRRQHPELFARIADGVDRMLKEMAP